MYAQFLFHCCTSSLLYFYHTCNHLESSFDGFCRFFLSKAVDESVFGSIGNFSSETTALPFEIDEDVHIIGSENFYHLHKVSELLILTVRVSCSN